MVDLIAQWAAPRVIDVVADSAYCNDTLTRALDPRVTVFGAIRPDAVLTAAPTEAERKAHRPAASAASSCPNPSRSTTAKRHPWHSAVLTLYGRPTTVYYKTLQAQWYRGAGDRVGRVVIVHTEQGAISGRRPRRA